VFQNNSALYGGAIAAIDDVYLSLINSTLEENSAIKDGGALYSNGSFVLNCYYFVLFKKK